MVDRMIRDPMATSDGSGAESRRRRGPQACESCHERKVRCDVGSIGNPCSTCSASSLTCRLRSRKAYKTRRPRNKAHASSAGQDGFEPRQSRITDAGSLQPESFASNSASTVDTWSAGNASIDPTLNKTRKETFAIVAAVATDDNETPPGEASIFLGDQHGFGPVFDLMKTTGVPTSQHYTIPHSTTNALDPDDLIYLKSKGCFSLPSQAICESMIRSYFHFVHPSLPIVDARAVLGPYTTIGFEKVNLLLLWSMFSLSASYIDLDIVHLSGYKSHREMKAALYKRAKCLYDNGYEQDRVALVQSAILLGLWFPSAEDRTASWYWTGIAISLGQTLGFHRNSDDMSSRIPIERQRLWRRIWWCCHFRDKWLSLGMGRPMRINPEDCDVTMPSIDDIMDEIRELPRDVAHKFLPNDIAHLASNCLKLFNLSIVLGEILATNYRSMKSKLRSSEVELLEKKIHSLNELALPQPEGELSKLSDKTLQLFKEAALIVLYRPYAKEDNQSQITDISVAVAKQKIGLAAMSTNNSLDSIIANKSVRYLGPMM